jgi:hypothetical protein
MRTEERKRTYPDIASGEILLWHELLIGGNPRSKAVGGTFSTFGSAGGRFGRGFGRGGRWIGEMRTGLGWRSGAKLDMCRGERRVRIQRTYDYQGRACRDGGRGLGTT